MKKRMYRAVSVKCVDVARVLVEGGARIVIGLDVAKRRQVASLFGEADEALVTLYWLHPVDSGLFFDMCKRLQDGGAVVEVVLEPSGTYGDPFQAGLVARGVQVFHVQGKRVKDASSIWDGVTSGHDGKSAQIIARLHQQGLSRAWVPPSRFERDLAAAHDLVRLAGKQLVQVRNLLESRLARHWPEVTTHLALGRATLLALLEEFGGPSCVATQAAEARVLMRRIGRSFLREETIDAVLTSARTTTGVPTTAMEQTMLSEVAAESLRIKRRLRAAEKRLIALSRDRVPLHAVQLVGAVTAAALVARGVEPMKYESAGAFLKSIGLNLREFSSGNKQGKLRISKRGNSHARHVLYMAALRLIRDDPIVRAWYRKKRARDGESQSGVKAVVAVERKLAVALWNVWCRNEKFDATRLFDVGRLQGWLDNNQSEGKEVAMAK